MPSKLPNKEMIDDISNINEDFLSNGKCPYSKVTGYLNKLASVMSQDKMPKIKDLIQYLLHNTLGQKNVAIALDAAIEQPLTIKNDLKLKTYVNSILYIQKNLYDIVQSVLHDIHDQRFINLQSQSSLTDLKNVEQRGKFGYKLFIYTQDRIVRGIVNRDQENNKDRNYIEANKFAEAHAIVSKGTPQSLIHTITQGFCDGFTNFWTMVHNIPELFEAKYGRKPTAQEYREIAEKNIKKVILPLASLNLQSLVGVIRPQRDIPNMLEFINNSFGITPEKFYLNEDEFIEVNNNYMHEVSEKMLNEMNDYRQASAFADLLGGDLQHTAEYPMRTGCPALAIKMKDDKRMIEQFCLDILTLLDKIYFPHWDK